MADCFCCEYESCKPERPSKARCPVCEGEGDIFENGRQAGPCTHCRTTGAVEVGVFEMKCPTPCVDCDGVDHHWMPHTELDFDDNPLVICKHCSALRILSGDDEF